MFKRLEKVLWGNVLARLFFGISKTFPPVVGYLDTFPVNKSGLSLHNSVTSSSRIYTSSLHASYELIGPVAG